MGKFFFNSSLILQAGLILTPLRLCTGWLMFSAFWRRVVLKPESLDVLSPMYQGLKFNHFIPSSIGITPIIEYFIDHPQFLYIFIWAFTILEGLAGIGLLLGLLTRLASALSFFLLLGIMLGAGWLGTTCVDEWQIGIFGTSACLVLFFSGGGSFSLDRYFSGAKRFWSFWASAPLFSKEEGRKTYWLVLILSICALAFALATNQINVGGVWGPFKNKALKPNLVLSDLTLNSNGNLKMNIYRNAGPDTYGSFIISINITDKEGHTLIHYDAKSLGSLPISHIHNRYLLKIQPNEHSLVVPLGSLATVTLSPPESPHLSKGNYFVEVTDIDGATWKAAVPVE